MRTRFLVIVLSVIAILMATALAWDLARRNQLQELRDQANNDLSLNSNRVLAEIERYRNLPFVLGQDERIHRLLDARHDPTGHQRRGLVHAANRYLESVNHSPKSDQFFIVNEIGTAIASSNWRDPKSFVGQSYKFRPYFRNAIASGEGHHYAVGATTKIPGHFMAHRIVTQAGNIGIIVVKVDIASLESNWKSAGARISLIDDVGIDFLSSVEGWKYHPLYPLTDDERARIRADRLYPDETIDAPPVLPSRPDFGADLSMQVMGADSLVRFMEIPGETWWIMAAFDVAPVFVTANLAAAIVFLGGALLFVSIFYLVERRHRSRANRLREILENMSAGIAVFEPDLRLAAWNQKYIGMNSYPPSLVRVGRPYADIIRHNVARGDYGPGDPKKQLQERLDRVRQPALRHFEIHRADGTWVDIVRNRMPDGTLVQTYADITERKRAEAELDAHRNNLEGLVRDRTAELVELNGRLQEAMAQAEIAKKRAEDADRAKTTFLNSVSHDIRNPLNAILGYAGLILPSAKEGLPEKQYQNLQKLVAKGRELNEMVNDFLDYTRAEHVTPTDFALAPLVRECLVTIDPVVDGRRVRIGADIPDSLPLLNQDERKLKRSLINLLGNAAKFTENGEIRIAARQRGNLLDVSVTDTGIGIPQEYLEQIFEEFQRIENRGERPREGTGLGLAICRRFAILMEGTVTVRSAPGHGSTFTLTIPIVHSKAAAGSRAAREGHDRMRRPLLRPALLAIQRESARRRLIVDDSK
ncbi:MAG: hypothetical protein HC861_09895, partial [Rhodospirillaceae bacterium]|nr:hypothetical protein [Rhodospirillaceae bacterium]